MKANVPEFLFKTRSDFRAWLGENAETSDGIWLIFGKTKAVETLSPNDALEEALCFGWIDGLMQRVDDSTYLKYFAKRRPGSPWSDKNKKIIEMLRERGIMTNLGEKAVEVAKKKGTWDVVREPFDPAQTEILANRLKDTSPAYEIFLKLPPSAKRTYTMRHMSFKSEDARQRDLQKIIDELNKRP